MKTLSSTCPEDFRREKIYVKLFFKMFSEFERKASRPLAHFWSAGPWKEAFLFCQRNFVTRNNFFQVIQITIENFWPPTVSFLDFWRKRLAGILKLNYSCQEELSAKKLLFHKISYFHESFGTLGEQFSILYRTLSGRAIEKATYVSGGTLWRKTNCFREGCIL